MAANTPLNNHHEGIFNLKKIDDRKEGFNHHHGKKKNEGIGGVEKSITVQFYCDEARKSFDFLTRMEPEECTEVFRLCIQHQMELFKKGYIDKPFGTITVKDSHERSLFKQPFIYNLVPKFMAVGIEPSAEFSQFMNIGSVQFSFEKKFEKLSPKELEEIFKFSNYFKYILKTRGDIDTFHYLTENIIDRGIESVQKRMIGMENYVEVMKTEVRMLTSSDIPRGFLFWGPPGTGKTTVAQMLCEEWTVHQVCDSLASGDFQQGIVGDSERMIRHIGERASVIPWILCAVVIDEIDALVQSRESKKGDANTISVLLNMIGGSNDVPNLIFFGSTNLLHTMDKAFLRRMDGKFFIGKPSFEARKKWIELYKDKIGFDINYEDIIETMTVMTINFSHDAMRKLLKKIMVNRTYDHKDKLLGINEIIPFINHISKMNKIYFGTYLLTDLIQGLNNIKTNYPSLADFWPASTTPKNSTYSYTGRMLIDMTKSSLELEYGLCIDDQLFQTNTNSVEDLEKLQSLGVGQITTLLINTLKNLDPKIVNDTIKTEKEKLASSYAQKGLDIFKLGVSTSRQKYLMALLQFAVYGNFDTVYYIDANTFYSTNEVDEPQILRYMESIISECLEYNSSMIIFDLDSIVEVSREYSGLRGDEELFSDDSTQNKPTFNYLMQRRNVFNRILRLMSEQSSKENATHWYCILSNNEYLLKLFKSKVGWPNNQSENQPKEYVQTCKHCKKEYMEKENNERSCCFHTLNKLYHESERLIVEEYEFNKNKDAWKDLSVIDRKKAIKSKRDEIFTLINTFTKEEVLERLKRTTNGETTFFNISDVRWVCCGRGFYDEGEILQKHTPIMLPTSNKKESSNSRLQTNDIRIEVLAKNFENDQTVVVGTIVELTWTLKITNPSGKTMQVSNDVNKEILYQNPTMKKSKNGVLLSLIIIPKAQGILSQTITINQFKISFSLFACTPKQEATNLFFSKDLQSYHIIGKKDLPGIAHDLLWEPHGLALCKTHILITDTRTKSIKIINREATFSVNVNYELLHIFILNNQYLIASAADGSVINYNLSDLLEKKIVTILWRFSGLSNPRGLTVSGELVYICEMGKHVIKALSVIDGTEQKTIGANDGINLSGPCDVKCLSTGELVVTEYESSRIQIISRKGYHYTTKCTFGASEPTSVSVDLQNHIFVTDVEGLKMYSTNGKLMNTFSYTNETSIVSSSFLVGDDLYLVHKKKHFVQVLRINK